MGKIKLNLVSGAIVEKPLVSAFNANGNSYVVLDNEINGSMGLPIILVSKLDNNKLIKIVDQGEWQIVKEYLKNIIAGGQTEFIKIDSEIAADDIYYTQLTLPVPSFDALKTSYKIENENITTQNISNPMDNVAPTTPVEESVLNPMDNVTPTSPVEENVLNPMDNVTPTAPVEESVLNPMDNVAPTSPVEESVLNPINDVTPTAPVEESVLNPINDVTPTTPVEESILNPMDNVTPTAPVEESVLNPMDNVAPTSPVEESVLNPMDNVTSTSPVEENVLNPMDSVTPTPPVEENILNPIDDTNSKDNIFKEQKEAFMQACENMFDALVQKFEKELENRN